MSNELMLVVASIVVVVASAFAVTYLFVRLAGLL